MWRVAELFTVWSFYVGVPSGLFISVILVGEDIKELSRPKGCEGVERCGSLYIVDAVGGAIDGEECGAGSWAGASHISRRNVRGYRCDAYSGGIISRVDMAVPAVPGESPYTVLTPITARITCVEYPQHSVVRQGGSIAGRPYHALCC